MEILQNEKLERYILEMSVLFMTPEFVDTIPSCLKVLVRTMEHWNVWNIQKNRTFTKNLLRSLQFVSMVNNFF